MHMLHSLFTELKEEFAKSQKGDERGPWFIYTLLAIILPFTSSRTSNLLRALKVLFGFSDIQKKRYYTFMASSKIPWSRPWPRVWKMIPEPETNGRLLVALDDFINPKTGYRQCRNPNQKSSSSYKPSGFLYDGHFNHMDLCLPVRKNANPETCSQRLWPFRLFRCLEIGGGSSIGQ
jgi:hypothetical protein